MRARASSWDWAPALLSYVVIISACASGTGTAPSEADTDGSPTTSTSGDPSGSGGTTTGAGEASALVARTWRLSHDQYEKSVVDLVGVEPDLSNFAPESGNGMFANFASTAFVRIDLAANYFQVAKNLAETLSVEQLQALTSCDLSVTCRDQFITELGEQAFRSPIPTEIFTKYQALFDVAAAEGSSELGYRALVAAILNSPLFLYRKEIGPEAEAASPTLNLTDYQLAEFLSFSLLGAPPPTWLREQVETTGLGGEGLVQAVEALLDEPGFHSQLTRFLAEWAEVTRFDSVEKTDVFGNFAEVKSLMQEEAYSFFEQSGGSDRGMTNLLLDPVPSVSPALDQYYFSDPSAPAEAERLGVLGLGAVLASHAKSYLTSPTQRGTFVRKRMFCREINLPEGFTPPPITETESLGVAKSTRELYELHLGDATCAHCHELTDNIGFVLESFDGAGRFRTQDSTQGPPVPLNLASELTDTDVDRPMNEPRDLNQALAESVVVKNCMAQQAFRFYFGQMEEDEKLAGVVPAVAGGRGSFTETDSLGALILGLLRTSTTTERVREVQE